MNENTVKNKSDLGNSKTLFVLKIVTMSFAILACVVLVTVMLTKWIMELNRKVKESNTTVAKAAARLNKFRKDRIKHILKQRRLQLKEEKEDKKKRNHAKDKNLMDMDDDEDDDSDDVYDITDEESAIDDFDNELSDIMIGDIDI